MDLSAQRKRRQPITYGKLFGNRRKLPSDFGGGFEFPRHEIQTEDVLMDGGDRPLSRLQDSNHSISKTLETSRSKLPDPQPNQHKSPRPVTSRNGKLGLERANSTSEIQVADEGVFDVPSSDEDSPKVKPMIRRALSSSQKKVATSRLEEHRIPPTGRSVKTSADKGETNCPPPIATLGQTKSKVHSSAMSKTVNTANGGRLKVYPKPAAKVPAIEQISYVKAVPPQRPTLSSDSSIASTSGQREPKVIRATSSGAKVLPRTKESQEEKDQPQVEEERGLKDKPRVEGKPVSKETSNDTGIITTVDVSLNQRRPRKYREQKKSDMKNLEEKGRPDYSQTSIPKFTKPIPKTVSREVAAMLPPNTHIDIDSLYIPSPLLKDQAHVNVATELFSATREEPSLWDEIMGETALQEHSIVKKPPRSRELEDIEHIKRGSIPPRKKRLIDTLEVDRRVYQSKKRVAEVEMDADSVSENDSDTPMIALSESQTRTQSQDTDELEDAAQTFQRGVGAIPNAPTFPERNSRVTYARQRSFLTDEVKEGDDPFADPLLVPIRDLGRGLRKAAVVEEEEEEDQGIGMMKSLHELREAGVNKRFLDSVEGLFEDIERNVTLGQKRLGYLELATKLLDKAFLQKFRANNFERRLLKDLGKQNDEIVRFILCFIVWNLLEEDSSSQVLQLVHQKGIISMLDSMLDSTRDMRVIAKDKKTNMTKVSQLSLLEFCDLIKTSKIFGGKTPKALSPQILALAVLDSVMKGLRRAGFMGDCLSITTLKKLAKSLEPFQLTVNMDKRKQIDPLFVELPVSILESHSIGIGRDDAHEFQLPQGDLDILANIVPGVFQLEGENFKPIQLLILRLHINLTNHRPDMCDIFGKPGVISALTATTQSMFEALSGVLEEEERLIKLDMLVLSLALMINFAEMSDSAGLSFIGGPYETSQISVLLRLFLGRMERAAEVDSMEESQSNVAFGYLSILLGNLCQNTAVRNVVRSKMPKENLGPLVSAVQEFVSHNQKVDEQRREVTGGEGESWHKKFTERLEQVANRLKAIEGYS